MRPPAGKVSRWAVVASGGKVSDNGGAMRSTGFAGGTWQCGNVISWRGRGRRGREREGRVHASVV